MKSPKERTEIIAKGSVREQVGAELFARGIEHRIDFSVPKRATIIIVASETGTQVRTLLASLGFITTTEALRECHGQMEVGGEKEQVEIGDIAELEGCMFVSPMLGCSKPALLEVMQLVANETEKPVKAEFCGEMITAEYQNPIPNWEAIECGGKIFQDDSGEVIASVFQSRFGERKWQFHCGKTGHSDGFKSREAAEKGLRKHLRGGDVIPKIWASEE
jgi:hypothetical protein